MVFYVVFNKVDGAMLRPGQLVKLPAHDVAHQLLPAGQLAQNTADGACASQHFKIAIKEILDRVTAEMEIVWQSTFCDGFTILF